MNGMERNDGVDGIRWYIGINYSRCGSGTFDPGSDRSEVNLI
jgi:hypothetical protein